MSRIDTIVELYRSGKTLQEIGVQFNISRERVRQLLKRAGVTRFEGGRRIRAIAHYETQKTRLNEAFIRKWGHSPEIHRQLRQPPSSNWFKSPIGLFVSQRNNARRRHIEWKLTLAEWWNIWSISGKWQQRGRKRDQYVMSRYGDIGPYAVGNVYIQLSTANILEGINRRQEAKKRRVMSTP